MGYWEQIGVENLKTDRRSTWITNAVLILGAVVLWGLMLAPAIMAAVRWAAGS